MAGVSRLDLEAPFLVCILALNVSAWLPENLSGSSKSLRGRWGQGRSSGRDAAIHRQLTNLVELDNEIGLVAHHRFSLLKLRLQRKLGSQASIQLLA